ncbi:MAG: dephospho-CoA kinase [Betaproteobacteria bacterium]|nr:dephospho-CoA kinase [Betaproteobacteria bacterium]
MTYVVGLTGGIGSGKTAVADLFAALGAGVVDTDAIAHELTAPGGAGIASIAARFGQGVIAADGRLDRARMREIAFADANARKDLEAILHPLIRAESRRRVAESDASYVVLVVPLLVESGNYRAVVDRIAVVDCSRETQIARTMARSGLDRAQVERIMNAQVARETRLAAADDVIDNDGPRENLPPQVERLHRKYLRSAAKSQ